MDLLLRHGFVTDQDFDHHVLINTLENGHYYFLGIYLLPYVQVSGPCFFKNYYMVHCCISAI